MAEIVLTFISPIIGAAISDAYSFAKEQISLAWGLKKELNDLGTTLTLIQGVLEDAESRQEQDQAVAIWLQKLRDVAYEVVDLLDEYGYEMIKRNVVDTLGRKIRKKVRPFNPLAKYTPFSIYMARSIKRVKEDLEKFRGDAVWVQLIRSSSRNKSHSRGSRDPRTSCSRLDCSKVVGRHNDVSEMVNVLVDLGSQHKLSGISIVGMGGIGKTTLAKSIFQQVKSQNLYDAVVWVCVSEDFDEKRIFQEMFDHLNESGGSFESFNALLDKLESKLENKKILLVLDDVWDENPGKCSSFISRLSAILKSNGNSIVVTTRSDKVACIMERLPMHKNDVLKLSDEECWLIIEDIIRPLFTETSIPPELSAIGREIAEKCRGLPLVASVIGGTLSHDTKAETWEKIRDDGAWLLQDKNKEILSILKISFDRLPSPLKKCFSYCSVFPKDYMIEKDDLIQLWMAQGYLHSSEEVAMTMEDTGNMYFNDILSNCLFQDVSWNWKDGSIESCKMHDLVHDLAISVSGGETLIWDGICDISKYPNIRHLWVQFGGVLPLNVPRGIAQRLHSLFFEDHKDFSEITSNLKSLRSLKVINYYAEELPMVKLKHLRYLSVLNGSSIAPPKSIFKLYNLQTLKLITSTSYQKLHSSMENMINLRRVHFIPGPRIHFNPGPSWRYHVRLTSIQSSSQLMVGNKGTIEELVCKSMLRGDLQIRKLELAQSTTATLEERDVLHRVTNVWSSGSEIWRDEEFMDCLCPRWGLKGLFIANYRGNSWPSWITSSGVTGSSSSSHLQNVEELILTGCNNCGDIPNLGLLPNLKVLHISHVSNMKSFGHNFFANRSIQGSVSVLYPTLVKLTLKGLESLEEWVEVVEDAATSSESIVDAATRSKGIVLFPCLETLDINNCPRLKTWSMPGFSPDHKLSSLVIHSCYTLMAIPSMEGLSSLKTFEIESCNKLKSLPAGLESCASLLELTISHCSLLSIPNNFGRLQSLSSLSIIGSKHLRSIGTSSLVSLPHLKNLVLGSCSDELALDSCYLTEVKELSFLGLDWIHAPLQSLSLHGWKRLKSLPHQLQHLTTLETLSICNFNGVEAVPEWIRNLTSLQELKIGRCSELKHLPSIEAMRCLSNLHTFEIWHCPKLKNNDYKKGGPGWRKISCIPNFKIVIENNLADSSWL